MDDSPYDTSPDLDRAAAQATAIQRHITGAPVEIQTGTLTFHNRASMRWQNVDRFAYWRTADVTR